MMNIQDRMKILELLNEEARGTLEEWMRRIDIDLDNDDWHSGEYRVAWMEDGTAEIQDQHHTALLRFRVEITTSAVLRGKNEPDLSYPKDRRPWCQIPAGWFVESPKDGTWLEVLGTIQRGILQDVRLRLAGGVIHTWPRPAQSKVWCVPGTMPSASGKAMADAFNVLSGTFPAVQIIEDQAD